MIFPRFSENIFYLKGDRARGDRLGNTKKTVGFILLAIGIILVILGMVFIGIAAVREEKMQEIADGSDFHYELWGYYEYTVDSTEARTEIEISFNSRSSNRITADINVFDPQGEKIDGRRATTPTTITVDVSSDLSDYWDIRIDFIDDSDSMNNVDVTVKGDGISGATVGLCCSGSIMPLVGVILITIAIILIVLGSKQQKKDKQMWNNRSVPVGPPSYSSGRYPDNSSGPYPDYRNQDLYGSTQPGSAPQNSHRQQYGKYSTRHPASGPPQGQVPNYQQRAQTAPNYQTSSTYGRSSTNISIPVPEHRPQSQQPMTTHDVQSGSLDKEPGLAPPPPKYYNEN
jgi:uncharacterized membrane protein